MLVYTLLAWVLISLLDAACKGRVAARYAPSTDVPWHLAPNFWSDTHPGWWKWRNILALISVAVLSVGGWQLGPRFAVHFARLFVLEFPGYWAWIAVLGIKQAQWFGENVQTLDPPDVLRYIPHVAVHAGRIYRFPVFGDLPADPAWLPGWYRSLGLHRWSMIGIIVAGNVIGAFLF